MSNPQRFLRAFVVLSMVLVAASPVTAFPISQKMSVGELKSTCSKVGGEFLHEPGVMGICTKKNCDSKGGQCQVTCNEGSNTCRGTTPAAQLKGPQTLISILQNGDRVLHDIDHSPASSLSSPSDSGAAPTNPAPGPLL